MVEFVTINVRGVGPCLIYKGSEPEIASFFVAALALCQDFGDANV